MERVRISSGFGAHAWMMVDPPDTQIGGVQTGDVQMVVVTEA